MLARTPASKESKAPCVDLVSALGIGAEAWTGEGALGADNSNLAAWKRKEKRRY